MSDNYIKKQVEAIRYHSDRLVKSYGGGSYCLKCDNCIDKHPCHICNPEPTIKVSELREWILANSICDETGTYEVLDTESILAKFCGGKCGC